MHDMKSITYTHELCSWEPASLSLIGPSLEPSALSEAANIEYVIGVTTLELLRQLEYPFNMNE